jgi:hypothetical protein
MGGSAGTGVSMGGGMSGSDTAGHDMANMSQTPASGGMGMMQGDTMAQAMTRMAEQMNEVMNSLRENMKGDMSHDNMAKMSQIMTDMSKEMSDMSKAMNRGKVSDKQMQTMQGRLAQMKTTLDSVLQQ